MKKIRVLQVCEVFCVLIFFTNISTLFEKVEGRNLSYPEKYYEIELPNVIGAESLAFDCHGRGPYVGVSDGRVLKWEASNQRWKDFATTSPKRTRDQCDGSANADTESICGRPLGLKMDPRSCNLYIADASFGLLTVGPEGGLARPISTSFEGVPYVFINGVDIDPGTGVIYFTESSTRFQRRESSSIVETNDTTGRVMKYDPRTRKTTVLLRDLAFANGIAVSKDSSFLLVGESLRHRVHRVWLTGRRARTSEIFAQLDRVTDNIKRTQSGEFWVALYSGRPSMQSRPAAPQIADSVALKFDCDGHVVSAVDGRGESALEAVTEVEEHAGALWFGSTLKKYVGVIKLE